MEEQELIAKSFVLYQTGKGQNHLVPVTAPEDMVSGLNKIADTVFRLQCGIDAYNSYLCHSTDSSEFNVNGWHDLNQVCCAAGVEVSKITATKMRHLASTMYASLEIPESKRAAFYSHMGYSKRVNEAIHQAPLAEQGVLQVGTILQQFGKIILKGAIPIFLYRYIIHNSVLNLYVLYLIFACAYLLWFYGIAL